MQETNMSGDALMGHLKLDLEKYAALSPTFRLFIVVFNNRRRLIQKGLKFVKGYDAKGKIVTFIEHEELEGKIDDLIQELNSFGASFVVSLRHTVRTTTFIAFSEPPFS
jgi:hypothetical protein